MPLTSFFEWIEGLQAVRLIVTVPGIYPMISALHILGIGVLFGSILPVDLRLLGVLGADFDAVVPALIRLALCGFALTATTGIVLASVRIGSYAQNPAFLAKLVILLAAGTNAIALRVASHTSDVVGMVGGLGGRTAALVSLSLWSGAVVAGRWIAFI
ncbi:DUF6644 family protein [Aureimonas mangrovi]|uniref:DUF6644 family protein n=1 Tax=Aureimonas mangrovi TaxID=2758041 RepID=UPI00163DC89F|nr:DUF6644 family protein [Aureimonas mangrovi]